MKYIGIYIYLFFLLYGPKLFGYIDTSIIANIIALYFLTKFNLKLNSFVNILALWIVFIILCYMGVAVYYESFDFVFVGRLIRSLCTVLCLYGFCLHFNNYCLEKRIDWIVNVIMVHAIIVIISATIFVDLQEYLRPLNDFGIRARKFRSTGLMAGYDISGLICNIGVALVLIKKDFNIIKFFVFICATLLTSRFSIISLFFILSTYIILMKWNISIFKFIIIALPLILAGFIGVVMLALTTSNILSESLLSSKSFSSDFLYTLKWTYAQTDLNQTYEKYYVFPDTFLTLLFGLGHYGGTDPGYFRVINCVGVVGLTSIILWHVFLIYNFFSSRSSNIIISKLQKFIGIVFVSVLLFLNLKNSYFFTGTFFEIMLYVMFNYMFESNKKLLTE